MADGRVQYGSLCFLFFFADSERPSFEDMLAPPGDFERVARRGTPSFTLAPSTDPPLDEVPSFGQRLPVIPTFGVARNRNQLPALIHFDLLENVYARHAASCRQTV